MPRFVGGQAAPARLLAEKLTPFGTHSDGEPPLVADCALAVRAQERGDASPEERATPPLLIASDRLYQRGRHSPNRQREHRYTLAWPLYPRRQRRCRCIPHAQIYCGASEL